MTDAPPPWCPMDTAPHRRLWGAVSDVVLQSMPSIAYPVPSLYLYLYRVSPLHPCPSLSRRSCRFSPGIVPWNFLLIALNTSLADCFRPNSSLYSRLR